MLKKVFCLIILSSFVFLVSGCTALVGAALSAGAAYGISQAFK